MNSIILLDSDGTLRHNDGSISKRTIDIIEKLKENNYIILASGRPRYHVKEVAQKAGISPYIVSANGAEVYDYINDKVLYSSFVEPDIALKLIECAYKFDIRFLFESGNIEYVTKDVHNNNEVLLKDNYKEIIQKGGIKQCMFITDNKNLLEKVWGYVENTLKIKVSDFYDKSCISRDSYWFSICNKTSSKGKALKFLSKHFKIENTIAIGNNYNDLSMFKASKTSVCVDNALPDIKEKAKVIVPSNDLDGVAIYLEKIKK